MKLSIVILNWNAADDTIACLRSLQGWNRIQTAIWVVDNGSEQIDLTTLTAFLWAEVPSVTLVRNEHNLGFSGGTNCGIAAALAGSDAPILLLNNDARIAEEATIHLLELLEQVKTAAIIAPLLYHGEEPHSLHSAGSRDPVWHHQNQIKQVPEDVDYYTVDYVSGAVIMIRSELLRTIGRLDERYFFNLEVADLCKRAKQHGWSSLIDKNARAYHNLDRSARLRNTLYVYYIIRNRFLYIRKFYQIGAIPLAIFWSIYGVLLWLKLCVAGQSRQAKAVAMGVVDGFWGRWGGQNERVLAATSPPQFPCLKR